MRHKRPVPISIHAPLAGSDNFDEINTLANGDFNPRSPRGERLNHIVCDCNIVYISIHAPLAGSDLASCYVSDSVLLFQSTLPSRGATDGVCSLCLTHVWRFQSTLPSRGATGMMGFPQSVQGDFNPRSPRGERQPMGRCWQNRRRFQSTLPSRGATRTRWRWIPMIYRFQSTLPSRGATIGPIINAGFITISIHAPLAGSDWGSHKV